MSKTINAQVLFHVVAKIDDNVDIENFLLKDTEWIGEPKNNKGCVISITPKKYNISVDGALSKNKNISNKKKLLKSEHCENVLPIVKAVKRSGGIRWVKKYKIIKQLLLDNHNDSIFMVQYPDGSINFNVKHEDIIKQNVCIVVENNQMEIIYGK